MGPRIDNIQFMGKVVHSPTIFGAQRKVLRQLTGVNTYNVLPVTILGNSGAYP